MEDRDNICDICGKPIVEERWDFKKEKSVRTGQKEMETPEGLIEPTNFGDGVIHKACLKRFIQNQIGAGI